MKTIIYRFAIYIYLLFKRETLKVGAQCNIRNTEFEKKVSINKNSIVSHSKIGCHTYIGSDCDISFTKIGRFCSLASRIKVAIGEHPTSTFVSTHPGFYLHNHSLINWLSPDIFSGEFFDENRFVDNTNFVVVIGSDVWIGANVTILSGVRIGNGAIIAAGSVVTKNVEEFSIVAGVPAREIKKRF